MKLLTELGLKHNTDKAYFHLFTEFYNDYFMNYTQKSINILEIGISGGNSLLMLKEFFPKATIYAIDINMDSVNLNLGDSIYKYVCDQTDYMRMQQLFSHMKFDIIIDDGSHITSHQQKSLGYLFPLLNTNGIYICEDLHTSYVQSYIDTSSTTLELLEKYKKTKILECDIISSERLKYINANIVDIILYERNVNAPKCYKCNTINNNDDECRNCSTNLSPQDKSITSILFHK